MTLKKPISFSEQVQMLLSHGIAIKDERKVEQILESINYYRLTGYALQFRKDPDDIDCVEGTSFEQILQVYQRFLLHQKDPSGNVPEVYQLPSFLQAIPDSVS